MTECLIVSVTIEDLQEESALPGPIASVPQLTATEAITFKFQRMDTTIAFTNHLGKENLFNE